MTKHKKVVVLFFALLLSQSCAGKSVFSTDLMSASSEISWYVNESELSDHDADLVGASIMLSDKAGILQECVHFAVGKEVVFFSFTRSSDKRNFKCRAYYKFGEKWKYKSTDTHMISKSFLEGKYVNNVRLENILNGIFDEDYRFRFCKPEVPSIQPDVSWAWGTDGYIAVRLVNIGFIDFDGCPESIVWIDESGL